MSVEGENEIDSEVRVLESIFGDDLNIIERSETRSVIEMNVKPLESELHSPPTIRVTIEIGKEYPNVSPKVRLWQPRGVDERNLMVLNEEMERFLQENQGIPILYDIFRKVQEHLELAQKCPSGLCPICLNDFSMKEASVRTHCDHYIHRPCFVRYIRFSKEEIQRELSEWPSDLRDKVNRELHCPMCREPLREDDLSELDEDELQKSRNHFESNSNLSPNDTDAFDWDWRTWKEIQQKWEVIYQKQLEKGGIIDVNEERNRFLVTDETVLDSTSSSLSASEMMPPAATRGEAEREEWNGRDEMRNSSEHPYSRHNRHPKAIESQSTHPNASNKNRSRRYNDAASSALPKSSSRNQREHWSRDTECSHSAPNSQQQSNRRRYRNSNNQSSNGHYWTSSSNENTSRNYTSNSRNYASNSALNRKFKSNYNDDSNNNNNDNTNSQYYHQRNRKFMPSNRQKFRQQIVHPSVTIEKEGICDDQTSLASSNSTSGLKEVLVAPPPGFENLRISSGSKPLQNATTSASPS